MTTGRPRCSMAARSREEALSATASRVKNWLLIEQPGPWGVEALFESRMPVGVAEALHDRADSLGVRVILIRHPTAQPAVRTAYLANVGGDGGRSPVLVRGTFVDPEELLRIDLARLVQGRPVEFGEPTDDPIYLVCTNGRHDVCCAEQGRPLYDAVERVGTERVWECSHIGGDRFAANLVCLPHGVYFGRIDRDDAMRVVGDYEAGLLSLQHYRGRSSRPILVQAAEHFLRAAEGIRGIDELWVTEDRRPGGGLAEVAFAGPLGREWVVRLRATRAGRAEYLTCRADRPHRPLRFELLSIEAAARDES